MWEENMMCLSTLCIIPHLDQNPRLESDGAKTFRLNASIKILAKIGERGDFSAIISS